MQETKNLYYCGEKDCAQYLVPQVWRFRAGDKVVGPDGCVGIVLSALCHGCDQELVPIPDPWKNEEPRP